MQPLKLRAMVVDSAHTPKDWIDSSDRDTVNQWSNSSHRHDESRDPLIYNGRRVSLLC